MTYLKDFPMNFKSKFVFKKLLLFIFSLSSFSANAAIGWLNDLTLKEVQLFYDNGYRLRVFVNEPIDIACADDAQGMLTYTGASMDAHLKGMQPMLQQAVASGVTVNLAYVTGSCAAGYGSRLYGVGVKSE
ncbi:MAG: hypothetical protein R3E62_09995 [Pseudomonadales bacterium]